MGSPDIKASAYVTAQIDAAIDSGARRIEKMCHRIFYPYTGTRYFDWPNEQGARYGRLWLDRDELISLISLESPAGTTVSTADVYLEPNRSGPPYSRIELNRGTNAAFSIGQTMQHSIVITGVWGYANDEESAGTLGSSITSGSSTITGVAARYGVGDLLRIDSERMLVTEKGWSTSGQTGTLTASNAAQSLAVSDGTAFVTGEELLLDAERVLVLAITGNTLTVQRACNGSALAAHTGATIYYARSLSVSRGQVGTTAASHSSGATVYRWLPPAPVRALNTAYALDQHFQEHSGYARTAGSGEGEMSFNRRGIAALEQQVYGGYARKLRHRGV